MWEEITTISEIDTIKPGTRLSKENPQFNNADIYKVTQINSDHVVLIPAHSEEIVDNFVLKPDTLFEKGWWMLKDEE
ncbi:MAG TPA: hypothetical protein PKM63_19390 [Panacibacter sp.]|nr:hypothetical protein [Panacibacter sp.]HNP46468.1 hypothetical protein [Panacibacter sp.]